MKAKKPKKSFSLSGSVTSFVHLSRSLAQSHVFVLPSFRWIFPPLLGNVQKSTVFGYFWLAGLNGIRKSCENFNASKQFIHQIVMRPVRTQFTSDICEPFTCHMQFNYISVYLFRFSFRKSCAIPHTDTAHTHVNHFRRYWSKSDDSTLSQKWLVFGSIINFAAVQHQHRSYANLCKSLRLQPKFMFRLKFHNFPANNPLNRQIENKC